MKTLTQVSLREIGRQDVKWLRNLSIGGLDFSNFEPLGSVGGMLVLLFPWIATIRDQIQS
jgi:hypothetical protein